MKHQYFGDINDYRKYGLIRTIQRSGNLRTLIAWMLTPDDGSTDGSKLKYLDKPEKWEPHDRELYSHLQDMVQPAKPRSVFSIEYSNLLKNTAYYSDIVPQDSDSRFSWFRNLLEKAKEADLVFFDPDIGIEIKSQPYGRKSSSKYLYWQEIETLWNMGKSLLIYQHFIREDRKKYTVRLLNDLKSHTEGSFADAFRTSNVLFLLALQPRHKHLYEKLSKDLDMHWDDQIQSVNPDAPKIKPVKGKCPSCGSDDIGEIVYGMPTPELAESDEVRTGKIILGGCCEAVGAPKYKCNDCGADIFSGWKKYEFHEEE